MATVLLTRSKHDFINTYFFYWSNHIISEAKKKLFTILDLKDTKANKKTFTSYIEAKNPKLVIFNGHGSNTTILGAENEILLQSHDNESLMKGKIVYARCCDAGKELGSQCIDNGAVAFIGYKGTFYIYAQVNPHIRPLQDKIAKLFLEPSNVIPISLIKGNSAEEAYRKSQNALQRNISYLISSKSSKNEKEALPYLLVNKRNQIALGDMTARV